MAERRMFAKSIIDSDAFIDMPISARLLYYDLAMRADDDGFVNSPKKIMKMTGVAQNDIDLLILKKFIIPFESGVVVIKHWRIHNYIRKDTYNETNYKEEKSQLELDENKAYRHKGNEPRLQPVDEPSTQVRLGKDSIGKDRLGKDSIVAVIKSYEEEIGMATPTTVTTLESYLEDLSEDMIIRAIELASERNKKNLAYIKGILNSWIRKNYKTLADVDNEKQQTQVQTSTNIFAEIAREEGIF